MTYLVISLFGNAEYFNSSPIIFLAYTYNILLGVHLGSHRDSSVYVEEVMIMAELSDFSESTVINYEEAMDRFGGNKELYLRLASKFADDPHHARLKAALADSDIETAYRAAHSLKGVAGNLSFTDLYTVAARVSDALHSADVDTAMQNMDELDAAYATVRDALASLS